MSLYNAKITFRNFFKELFVSYLPNKRDNLKQISLKLFFIAALLALILSAGYVANYFFQSVYQQHLIDENRKIWHYSNTESEDFKTEVNKLMLAGNSDFKGWITIEETELDNPIYQTTNNKFYLDRNQKKEYSSYGTLFFDYRNNISQEETDKNLIIYGNDIKNGSMFGCLKKYKSLSFYKKNPTIKLSTLYNTNTYKIYSVFILNASKADDNGYIYNISRKSFLNSDDFNNWTKEAYERSVINTGVETQFGDDIITLVTRSDEFENSRLVIMARKLRDGETSKVNTSQASVNPNPRYPKRWYDVRGLTYPF